MSDTDAQPGSPAAPALPTELVEDLLSDWLPTRRWYPAKGRAMTVRLVADLPLPAPPTDAADVRVLVVDLAPPPGSGPASQPPAADDTVTVQVPVVLRREAPPPAEALVGTLVTASGDRVHLCDGPADRAFVAAVLGLLSGATTLRSAAGWVESVAAPTGDADDGPPGSDDPAAPAAAVSAPASAPDVPAQAPAVLAPASPDWSSRVLSGEQSNTSVIVEGGTGTAVIAKVFRTLQEGENPDILLPRSLATAGSARVPVPVGHVRGGWTDLRGRPRAADLLSASEFLADAPDAWRTATRAVATGASFRSDARDLGAATAEVHAALAATLPRRPVSPELLDQLADSLAVRVRWAADGVGHLDADVVDRALALVGEVRALTRAPDWQRVHGDLHLGQVLRPPGRGWVLIDFEGEPLRPLAERVSLDTPVRDVASMLRSFDYAAAMGPVLGAVETTGGRASGHDATDGDAAVASGDGVPSGHAAAVEEASARSWAQDARDAYCCGYADVTGRDPREDGVLLRALELEKALYEVVYETRNRPDWVSVPLSAVGRLTSA